MFNVLPSQTLHSIESVYIPGGLPGVGNVFTAWRIFDLALIKLGKFQSETYLIMSNYDAEKSVNNCTDEDLAKCWKIEEAKLATLDTVIPLDSELTALGESPDSHRIISSLY